MRAPPEKQNPAPLAEGGPGQLNGLLAGETRDRDNPPASPLQVFVFRHHVDAPNRRPKSHAELRDGAELIELYDRRFPGRMSGRRP
jgi:hypothetical protein